jgi:hypothetical protein
VALGIIDASRATRALEGVVGKRLSYRVSPGVGAARLRKAMFFGSGDRKRAPW